MVAVSDADVPAGTWEIENILAQNGRMTLTPDSPALDAVLLGAPVVAGGTAAAGPASYVLVVTYECDVWSQYAIGAGQTRNVQPMPDQPAFSRLLWQAAPIVGVNKPVTVRPDGEPIDAAGKIARADIAILALVEAVLVGANPGLLQPDLDGSRWKARELTVTTYATLAGQMDSYYPDEDGAARPAEFVNHGRLPLRQVVAPAGSLRDGVGAAALPLVTWDTQVARFEADFVWTDSNNNEILRLGGVPIDFAP